MAIKRVPVSFAVERWMRMPGISTNIPTATPGELFVFSGYADFTGGSGDSSDINGPLEGDGFADTAAQETWVEYDIEQMVVGPHWRKSRACARPSLSAATLRSRRMLRTQWDLEFRA